MTVQITFLGGLGEVGRNCAALEVDGKICLIDCGLMFPEADMLGVDLVFPDWSWVVERADDVECVILTHGHEDHVGALGYFLEQVNVPVYGTELSLRIAGERIKELGVAADLRPVPTGEEITHGPFYFMLIPVCHSIPDATAVAFYTHEGVILHSGDFKLDPTPIDDRATDLGALAELGDRGVRLYLGDSTNAEREGFVPSEGSLSAPIADIVRAAEGRVIAACFSSHIHRVQQIVNAGVAAGRKIALAGRSMLRNSRIASELGVLELPEEHVVTVAELLRLPADRQMLIATGSQGEPFSALTRMSNRTHRQFSLEEGDMVLISATPVPGNEKAVSKLVSGMLRLGATVYHGLNSPVHVSGHAARDELAVMLRLVRPEAFVPVHGEYRHLHAHARLARQVGVEQIEVLEDGDRVVMEGDDLWVEREVVDADYVYLDGSSLGGVQTRVLRDRSRLSEAGVVTVTLVVDAETGELAAEPLLESRGLVDDPVAVLDVATDDLVELVSVRVADGLVDPGHLRAVARRTVARVVRSETRQRPVVLVEIVEV
ncbi:MAG: ribonuclease J [bacterium]|nr:ribonuclease J [Acidimicrobiia bacterium]MCY4649184.1 ribonuclease J [bacterium]